MKPFIKYISLLLFGGLMLPFYTALPYTTHGVQQPAKIKLANNRTSTQTPGYAPIFIYQYLAEIVLPQLIN